MHVDPIELIELLRSIPPHNPARYRTLDGFDNPKCSNADRAAFAEKTVKDFERTCGADEPVTIVASDLLADLLHMVHSRGEQVESVLVAGIWHFLCEAGTLEDE